MSLTKLIEEVRQCHINSLNAELNYLKSYGDDCVCYRIGVIKRKLEGCLPDCKCYDCEYPSLLDEDDQCYCCKIENEEKQKICKGCYQQKFFCHCAYMKENGLGTDNQLRTQRIINRPQLKYYL